MDVTPLPMTTDASLLQPLNAPSPIEVTLSGIFTDVSPQPEKADLPIKVTLLGIVTDARLLQP
jgi:hypothetical protein